LVKDIHKKKQKNATTSNGGHTIEMRHKTCVKKVSSKVSSKVRTKAIPWYMVSSKIEGE